jgi:hypothetical protein
VFHVKLPGHDAMARQDDEKVVVRQVKLPRGVVKRPLRQVGTTLEVLTERTRDEWRRNRWSQWFAGCTPRTQRRIASIA